MNERRNVHIITLEDPIEYFYPSRKAIISQREIGRDCKDFQTGLKAALREDPDVILVGEMRDPETVYTALMAAETGHLVLTTLHTSNVTEAIDRFMQYFPAEEQAQSRNELANCFEAIISQKLLPRRGGGRVAAFEVLLRNPATTNLIRINQATQLHDYMKPQFGMQTLEDSLRGLREMRLLEE